jgi:hypothetical protein
VLSRHAERDARVPDLALRPHQPLGHCRLGQEECARDLLGRQAAEGAEGEGDLRLERERRVAASEDELEPLVRNGRLSHIVHGGLWQLEQVGFRRQRPVPPDAVEGSVPSRCEEPRPGVRRLAVARPALCGDRECLLGGFLGEVEVAEEADHRREDAAPLAAKRLLEDR